MITSHYINQYLFFLTIPIFSLLLYLFGGNEETFDLIYIAALGVSCLFCKKNKDTLGVLVVLLGYWCLTKPLLYIELGEVELLFLYSICMGICIKFISHKTSKVNFLIVLFAFIVEIYWHQINYVRPQMGYSIALLTLTMLANKLLYYRVLILSKFFNYNSGKVILDVWIGSIINIYFILVTLMIIEYFVRHIGAKPNVLFIYNIFPFVSTLLSSATLAIIYMYFFSLQSRSNLKA